MFHTTLKPAKSKGFYKWIKGCNNCGKWNWHTEFGYKLSMNNIILYTTMRGRIKGAARAISVIYTGQYQDIARESGFHNYANYACIIVWSTDYCTIVRHCIYIDDLDALNCGIEFVRFYKLLSVRYRLQLFIKESWFATTGKKNSFQVSVSFKCFACGIGFL